MGCSPTGRDSGSERWVATVVSPTPDMCAVSPTPDMCAVSPTPDMCAVSPIPVMCVGMFNKRTQ